MENFTPNQPVAEVLERPKIEEWLFKRKLNVTRLAKAIGVARHFIQRGIVSPSATNFRAVPLVIRRKVFILTGGEVGLADWPEAVSDEDLAKELNLSHIEPRHQSGNSDDATTPSARTPAEGGLSSRRVLEASHHGAH
jgi:hypothetical protein